MSFLRKRGGNWSSGVEPPFLGQLRESFQPWAALPRSGQPGTFVSPWHKHIPPLARGRARGNSGLSCTFCKAGRWEWLIQLWLKCGGLGGRGLVVWGCDTR